MSDKANLTNAELELTQRIQMHFPRGVLSSEVLKKWNSCPTYIITRACKKAFAEFTENQQILEVLGTVNVPTTEDFVVRSYIRDMETRSNRIIDIEDKFKEWFFDQTAGINQESKIQYHRLWKQSNDISIIAELGGGEKVETTTAEMLVLLNRQLGGTKGALSTEGYWNIFFIRDRCCVLRAVFCRWLGDNWKLSAALLGVRGKRFFDYSQVFSRNSLKS